MTTTGIGLFLLISLHRTYSGPLCKSMSNASRNDSRPSSQKVLGSCILAIAEFIHTGIFLFSLSNYHVLIRCDANKAYQSAKELLQTHEKSLFPEQLSVTDVKVLCVHFKTQPLQVSRRSLKPSKENGGWGDTRDHALCRLNASPLTWRGENYSVLNNLLFSSVVVPNTEFHSGL